MDLGTIPVADLKRHRDELLASETSGEVTILLQDAPVQTTYVLFVIDQRAKLVGIRDLQRNGNRFTSFRLEARWPSFRKEYPHLEASSGNDGTLYLYKSRFSDFEVNGLMEITVVVDEALVIAT